MTNIMVNAPPNLSKKSVIQSVKESKALGSSHDLLTSQQRSKSLNRGARQREIQRITNENEVLLRRLQDKQSTYNVCEWEIERKKQEKLLKKICYYPPRLLKKSKLRSKRGANPLNSSDPNFELYQYYQTNFKPQPMPLSQPMDSSPDVQ